MFRNFRMIRIIFYSVLILGLSCLGFLLFRDMSEPDIVLAPKTEQVSPNLVMTLTLTDEDSGLKHVSVTVRRNDLVIPVLEETFAQAEKTRQVAFSLKDTGLKDSAVELVITATDASFAGFGRGNRAVLTVPMQLDSQPPRIGVKTATPYVRRGGTGCVLYSINKDVSQTGVKVDQFFFPGFRQPNGDYLCFFAYPFWLTNKDYHPQLVAVDLAGNAQMNDLPVNRMHQEFKKDTINISQGFLDNKAAEFSVIMPGPMSDIDRFLQVNGPVRRSNAQTLMEIGRDTAAEALWKGAFLRMPNSAQRADFAEHRAYFWQGQKVDEQTHLGYDLASVAQDAIPAANAGRVVFTGYLGIYGNMVVIDHGLGLQSLYSHMSSISVEKGQTVARGDILGRTGATGMAGGDHLHFGILIAGLEVNPKEWLDAHWIKDNVSQRIKAAGGSIPDIPAAEAAAGTSVRRAPAAGAAREPARRSPRQQNRRR